MRYLVLITSLSNEGYDEFSRGICDQFKNLFCLPINHNEKNKRKLWKLHVHTPLSFHHKPQSYEKNN